MINTEYRTRSLPMDKQTVRDLVYILDGYIVENGSEMSVKLPSDAAQEIFDLVIGDFDLAMLNDKIQSTLSGGLPDEEISALMETSPSWAKLTDSPTLDSDSPDPLRKAAKLIADSLEDDYEEKAAAFLSFDSRWELWIKVGPDES